MKIGRNPTKPFFLFFFYNWPFIIFEEIRSKFCEYLFFFDPEISLNGTRLYFLNYIKFYNKLMDAYKLKKLYKITSFMQRRW